MLTIKVPSDYTAQEVIDALSAGGFAIDPHRQADGSHYLLRIPVPVDQCANAARCALCDDDGK